MPASFCPYVGLQPYTEADRDYFFGRERDQRVISSNLYAAPLTVLYGATGVGKSSVLLAGVAPFLRSKPRTAAATFRQWQGWAFLDILKSRCLEAVEAVHQKPLEINPNLPFDDLLCAAAETFGGTIIVILDQFEEYFQYHPLLEGVNTFDAEFARAVNREDVDAGFLLALREDSLAKLDRFRMRIPNLLGNTLRLEHLDVAAAERAIRKPLDVYNARFTTEIDRIDLEKELVRSVLSQVRIGQVALGGSVGIGETQTGSETAIRIEAPFLQLVMTRLWDEEMKANSSILRLRTFERLGGAREIVHRHLYGVMDQLGLPEQMLCTRVFDRLVTPSGTKIACRLDDLAQWAGDLADRVPEVFTMLSNRRILRSFTSGTDASAALQYEIFHDVLAPAILDWRRKYLQKQAEAEAARQAAIETAQRSQEAARQRELEQVQTLATEQRLRAEEQATAAQRLRRQRRALVVMFLVAVASAGYALVQRERALANERLASSSSLSIAAIDNLNTDPELSILLARRAALITYSKDQIVTPETKDALQRAVRASRVRLNITGHRNYVLDVAFSPTSDRLVTASDDMTAKIWDAASGKELHTLTGHTAPVDRVVFSPDGRRVATAARDRTAKIWDAKSGKELLSLAGHTDDVFDLAFSPDGTRLGTASKDKTAKIWDAGSGRELLTLSGHANKVYGVAFSPDGKRIATASADRSARIWDAQSGQGLLSFIGHGAEVYGVAFSPDGTRLATTSRDKTARLWDARTEQVLRIFIGHKDSVFNLAFNAAGNRLATASGDWTAKVWDTNSGRALLTLSGHQHWVLGVAFSSDGNRLATASADTTAKVWDVSSVQGLLIGHRNTVLGIDFSPDGKRVVTGSYDNTARVWETASGRVLSTLSGHTSAINGVAFNSSGDRIATASDDRSAKIWDAHSGAEILTLKGHAAEVTRASFDPGRAQIATASEDYTARVWDLVNGNLIRTLSGHKNKVLGIAYSPDARHIATVSFDETAKIWDADTGRELFSLTGHTEPITVAVYSPDGKYLATAGRDRTAKIWDPQAGTLIATLSGHNDRVTGVAWVSDSDRVFTTSADRTVRLWEALSGRELFTLSGLEEPAAAMAISPDRRDLALAQGDTVQFLPTGELRPLRADELIDLAGARATRTLTPAECQRYLFSLSCPGMPSHSTQ